MGVLKLSPHFPNILARLFVEFFSVASVETSTIRLQSYEPLGN